MNFLQAHAALKAFSGGPELPVLLAMSGTGDPLELYIRAAAAEAGYSARVQFLPFGTLQQALLGPAPSDTREVLLLLPWDLLPELDWRTGISERAADVVDLRQRLDDGVERLRRRGSALLYVDVEGAPIALDDHANASWRSSIRAAMEGAGATVLPPSVFGLGSYLSSGQPVSLKEVGVVARAVVSAATAPSQSSAKVLVTDLDHTLWHGIIGDDGPTGIYFRPEGKGYRHFVYQTLLRRLRADGVLLAAVSKNDDVVARQPLISGDMVLRDTDFVAIVASWQPKSAQIEMLAEQLNLGLDAFVFVDDNPVEIAEVSSRLPSVHCVPFPAGEQGLAEVLDRLVRLFRRTSVTEEDRQRTLLYQRRMSTLPPREGSAGDIREFLRELGMTLTIEERTTGDRTRAVQLINKTNQFNINGLRLEDAEVEQQLRNGSRLFTASLSDRSGDHGQILAALLAPNGTLTSFVLSCRVFQRRVEHAFVGWLAHNGLTPSAVAFRNTERNGPARTFLEGYVTGDVQDGDVALPAASMHDAFVADADLFTWNAPAVMS